MAKKTIEEKIQEEVRKRVMDEEQLKMQRDQAVLERAGLDEVTALNREEVDKIAEQVRAEVIQKEAAQKKRKTMTMAGGIGLAVIIVIMAMTQYNAMVTRSEQVNTQWSQLQNVYQRRADVLPNLISVVQTYAAQEQEVARIIADARKTATGATQASGTALRDANSFAQFQAMQKDLSGALQQMMVLLDKNPTAKMDENFLALQAQIEGSENRIAVERKRFNEAVQNYNTYVKRFPQVIFAGLFGFKARDYQLETGNLNAPAANLK